MHTISIKIVGEMRKLTCKINQCFFQLIIANQKYRETYLTECPVSPRSWPNCEINLVIVKSNAGR